MISAFERLRTAIRRFARRENGSIAVETVIVIPMMFWTYMATYAIYDVYRMHSLQQKIAYSIGDIISRETNPIDNDYLIGMRDLVKYMSNISSNSDMSLRVTVVRWNESQNRHERDWSREKGYRSSLSKDDVRNMTDKLPVMTNNERLILVETAVKYTSLFNIGLGDFEIENRVFTRPRYAPQVLWSSD